MPRITLQSESPHSPTVKLGLRENWRQFWLLVLINGFVGGMVGLERTVVPLIGAELFEIASTTIILSFIVTFGIIKAVSNLLSGYFPIFTDASAYWSWGGPSGCRFPSWLPGGRAGGG